MVPHRTTQKSNSVSVVQTFLDLQQAQGCDHCPGEPLPMPKNPIAEETFPNIHSIPSGPIAGH